MSAFSLLRRAWHLVPGPVRARARDFGPVRMFKSVLKPTATDLHNDIYNAEYYADVDNTTSLSAPVIARSVLRDLKPRTLIDIGCGTGAMLMALRNVGIEVSGLEYSKVGLEYCRKRELNVRQFDLESGKLTAPPTLYDVVLSTEVAEHLPEALADVYVDSLVSQGKTIVFTAATPGQGGQDHVNEQPHQYWIDKFAKRGYTLDEKLSLAWRAEWKAQNIAFWYSQNLMIFRG